MPRWRANSGTVIRPQRGDLACWGEALAAFVAPNPQLADVPYLADVARVEWALHRAAGAPDAGADPASFALLTQADPDTFTLRLAPGTAVIAQRMAGGQPGHRPPARRSAPGRGRRAGPGARGRNAVVWRQALRPLVAACTPAEAALLAALLQGRSLLASLNDALEADAAFDLGAWLPGAVTQGVVLGAEPLDPRPGSAP